MDKIEKIKKFQSYEPNLEQFDVKEYGSYIENFAEEVFTLKERIDFGKSADVFRDPLNGCCYKVITRQSEALLSAEDEAVFLLELQKIKSDTRVPDPLFSLEATVKEEKTGKLDRKSLICMERAEAISLKDVLDKEKRTSLPQNFDVDIFFQSLRDFVKEMNEKHNIYHRDLHEGNILVDKETGMPWVIDFGLSKKKILTDEDPYRTESDVRNKIFTFKSDQDQIFRIEDEIRDLIKANKGAEGLQEVGEYFPDFSFISTQKANLKEIQTFSDMVRKAEAKMKNEAINASKIPGSLGLWLVKDNTLEFEDRKSRGVILYPKIIYGGKYFICRN